MLEYAGILEVKPLFLRGWGGIKTKPRSISVPGGKKPKIN
jgi:hypothetical protein